MADFLEKQTNVRNVSSGTNNKKLIFFLDAGCISVQLEEFGAVYSVHRPHISLVVLLMCVSCMLHIFFFSFFIYMRETKIVSIYLEQVFPWILSLIPSSWSVTRAYTREGSSSKMV